MEYPKVSIIILNWNGFEDTVDCLHSLKKINYPNYEVILVDNGSTGNDADTLDMKYGQYVTIISNDENYGFTGGNNIGIRHALTNTNPAYILLLNNDVTVHPEFLTEMVKVAEGNHFTGIVGPKTYFYEYPSLLQLVWCEVDMYRGQSRLIGFGQIDQGQYDVVRNVDYIQGSCFLIKRSVIDNIGLLDETYFAYWEDTDYCIRTRRSGFKILYAPQAKVWHKQSLGVKPWYKTLRRKDQVIMAPSCVYFMTLNQFRFLKKYATRHQYYCFLFYLLGYMFWWKCGVYLLYRRNIRLLYTFLKAIRDGFYLNLV